MERYTRLALLILVLIPMFVNSYKCPNKCLCGRRKYTVNCSDTGANSLPRLPNGTRYFYFDKNHLPVVHDDTFKNLSNIWISLKNMYLQYNGIRRFSNKALLNFTKLMVLDLTGNKLNVTELKEFFLGLGTVTHLQLSSLSLKSLPADMFQNAAKSHIRLLGLSNNNLTTLDGHVLSYIKNLQDLDARNNIITSIEGMNLTSLIQVNIANNKLQSFPDFCGGEIKKIKSKVRELKLSSNQIHSIDEQRLWCLNSLQSLNLNVNRLGSVPTFCSASRKYLPALQKLMLSYNEIHEVQSSQFSCLKSLKLLALDNNFITRVENNTFSQLPHLELLDLVNQPNYRLHFDIAALNSSTINALLLPNRMKFIDAFADPTLAFKYLPKLEYLNVRGIYTDDMTDDQIVLTFKGLSNLRRLVISDIRLRTLPLTLFMDMPHLTTLELGNNYISSWDDRVFENMTSLRKLVMYSNQISIINETSFPETIRKTLETIDLNGNPFACSCYLLWFRNWMKTSKVVFASYPDNYICHSPKDRQGTPLAKYNPTYSECHPLNPAIIAAIIVGTVLVFVSVLCGLLYKYRWNIKYYIYLLRKRKQYEPIPNGDEYVYDAFVAYNQADGQWVSDILIDEIESKENVKLCLHERDFGAGKFIIDNIVDKIEESRKVIIVLSNAFIKSEWCSFELKVAQHRFLEEHVDVLVVILLEDLHHVHKSARVLLNSVTYLKWSDDEVGQQLFMNKLRDALKRPTD